MPAEDVAGAGDRGTGPEPYTADWLAARGADTAPGRPPGTLRPGDVLVLRALGLGDALTAVAALRGLRRLVPDRRIVLAGPPGPAGLLAREGVVDDVLPLPGLVPLPDVPAGLVAVNLHGRGPASHRLLAAARPERLIAFGSADAGHAGPAWREEEHEVLRWCRLVTHAGADCGPEDLRLRPRAEARRRPGPADVVLHPGAASASRHWPARRWRAVAAGLAGRGHRVVVTGSAAEAPLGRVVAEGLEGVHDHTGRHDLAGLSAAVRDAGLVLSADTGIAHLATAWCVPSVVLFGPVPPAAWGPAVDEDLHAVLWHGDPDAGPWGDPHGTALDPLLGRISAEEVLAAAVRQLTTDTHRGRTHRAS
ncbi:glycosyltransferase family 9 protein [Citricoccus sp. SGAir0253]|uniref:glycosyltransferase family 9 protein n=1 Tax=Citricoccus sp. SGAir0253 TaxID=2567881 RepID=UPI0010CD05F8|nr:glycosyltransferase family 9 protein [Citricoccus sp. SGAir0253]QCU78077.1 glycosyltransferase family 9 protein [Citricoccus sp. SGAir0253]